MTGNYFVPSEHEVALGDRIAALNGDRMAIVQELARYRESLIKPLVGRAIQRQDPDDGGDKNEPVITRGDAFDIINRARRGSK